MIQYTRGDILADPSDALVNPVNCVGVMGAGLAKQFKRRFPSNFRAYAEICRRGKLNVGEVHVHTMVRSPYGTGWPLPPYIINFPTKRHWRDPSRLEDIEAGLTALADAIRQHGIRSVAVPALGSGLGGLAWTDVRPRIEAALCDTDADVTVYAPR